jgi:site-specific recombinase XerC
MVHEGKLKKNLAIDTRTPKYPRKLLFVRNIDNINHLLNMDFQYLADIYDKAHLRAYKKPSSLNSKPKENNKIS